MTALFHRIRKSINGRSRAFFRRHIWPMLPLGPYLIYNQTKVNIRARRFTALVPKSWLPIPQEDIETFESASVEALCRVTQEGDRVLVIGGGYGVTAVRAAQLTGAGGSVLCYEGAKQRVTDVEAAAALNEVSGILKVSHGIVGDKHLLFGESGEAPVIGPEDLPACDVLEMDCEGSEISILKNMHIRPRHIVVETHGFNGSTSSMVQALLEELGYAVLNMGVAVAHKRDYCEENDIKVLLGSLPDHSGVSSHAD